MKIGYIRISSVSERPKRQHDALKKFGCDKLFTDVACGDDECPELTRMLGQLKTGDTVVVWRLDRLAHDTKRQLQLTLNFEARDIGFVSLEENIDTTLSGGRSSFRKTMRWAQNNTLTEGTAIIYVWLKGYGHVKIENCKTGKPELDELSAKAMSITGCTPGEDYPGFDMATYLIDTFGGEIERIEYGPIPNLAA